jgi:hypothetical protein
VVLDKLEEPWSIVEALLQQQPVRELLIVQTDALLRAGPWNTSSWVLTVLTRTYKIATIDPQIHEKVQGLLRDAGLLRNEGKLLQDAGVPSTEVDGAAFAMFICLVEVLTG